MIVRKRVGGNVYVYYHGTRNTWIYLGKEKPIEEWVNKIHCGDAYKLLKLMPSESVDCVITSPPYWGLRVYGEVETIFGGNPACQHEWGDKVPVKDNMWRWDTFKDETHPNGKKQAEGTIAKDLGCFCVKCGAWLIPKPTMSKYMEQSLY
jgi:DNA modification methylase